MPTKKKTEERKPRTVAPKRKAGYLVCERCKWTIPYQGMETSDPAMDWPKHRCTGSAIRSFDSFTLEDPNRPPPLAKGESLYPEGWL